MARNNGQWHSTEVGKVTLRRRRESFKNMKPYIIQYFKDRGEWVCKNCGAIKKLNIHHIIPLRMQAGSSDTDNLMVLCEGCHKNVHNGHGEGCH